MKMPFINIKRSLWTIGLSLCLLVISNSSQAQRRPVTYTKTLSGAVGELAKDSSRTVIDSIYFHRLLFPKVDTTMSIDNMIVFYIDETSLRMPPDSFKVDLEVKIYFRNRDSIYDSINSRTLSIDYYKDRPYKSKAVYLFSNAPSVQVKVVNITTSYTTTANILPLLKLENRMAINRIFELDCSNTAITSISSNTTPVATKGELNVSWASINAAQEYDLEWTFVDQSALDSNWYLDGGVLSPALLFENNATRVTIAKNTYNIPLLYEGDGKLFFRVRAAQTELDGERKTTAWSSDYIVEGGLGEYTMTGHERKLNWQSSTSFAEEGKRKSVVQYFDGTLRNRQTVTKDNTTDTSTTIVAETLYDRQGRSKIQVLPSPSLKTIIEYNPLFNRAVGGIEYDKDKYDLLVNPSDYCETQAPPMDSVNDGASKYYSANNPDKDKLIHRYIPTASGYPFTEVKYTQDNTGRISSQGGVGPDFQLASGHETRYYYGTPEQRDLDALFGTEVGYASHYQKNMVRDANGQYSVSYVDMHGRTIATALAGRPPASLDTLSSYDSVMRVDNLLDRSNNIIKGKTIESTKGLVVTVDGNHTFIYTLDPESLSLKDKNNVDICYDCLYDLTITITGECKNNGTPNLQLPYVFRDSNMQVAAPWYDSTCTTARKFRDTIRVYLKEGSYVITKKLTLREDGMNWYRDSLYTPHNTVRTREQIIQEQLQQIRQRQGTCTDEPVTLYQYQAYREQILLDMTLPYGQYAKYQYPKEGNIFSIFDLMPSGLRLYQAVSYGNITPNPALYSPQEFINNFQPEWAEYLAMKYHPEWKALMVVEGLKSSYHWDEKFESTDTYAEAVAQGYLNPLNEATSPASLFTYGNDSMFLAGANDARRTSLKNNMSSYQNSGGDNYSLWAMANIIGHCDPRIKACIDSFRTVPSNLFNSSVLQCTGERDMAWRFFRDQYLYLKRKEINVLIQAQVSGVDADAIRVFPDPAVALQEAGDLVSSDLATAQQAARDSLAASINSTCKAYAERWWQQLQSCNYSKADSIAIIPLLIEVCKQGGDSTHPYGASTVTPSSTYAYRSFEDVINQYNQSHGIATNAACNAFLIDAPGPYNKPMALADLPVYSRPDSCACDKISTLYSQYQTSSGYTSFSNYIQQTLHTTISNNVLDSLRNLCSGAISCRYISNPLTLPPVLQCGTGYDVCVDCEQVNTVYTSFKASYPGTIPSFAENTVEQQNSNHLFSSYMNSKLGFGKSAQEYLSFLDTCGVSFGCDSLQALVKRYNKDVSPYRFRVAAQSNELVPAVYITNTDSLVSDGVLRWPQEIRDTTGRGWVYFQQLASGYNFCLENGYSVEFRFKLLKKVLNPDDDVFYFTDANSNFVIYKQEGAQPGLYLREIKGVAAGGSGLTTLYSGLELLHSDPDIIYKEWSKLKVSVTTTQIKVYFNDVLVKTVSRTIAPLTNWSAFTLAFLDYQGAVDWFKVYNSSGALMLSEDYNEPSTRALINPSFLCPAPYANCQTPFVTYFNQQKGTSYTYTQIDSIYLKTCGRSLDICNSAGASTCDTLQQLVLNYNTTVKVDTPSFSFRGNNTPYSPEIVWGSSEVISGGTAHSPARYQDSTIAGYPGLFFDLPCSWNVRDMSSFSLETRVRVSYVSSQIVYFHLNGFYAYYNVTPLSGKYAIRAHNLTYNGIQGANAGEYLDTLSNGFNDWVTLKLRYYKGRYQYWINGKLIKEYSSSTRINAISQVGFGYTGSTQSPSAMDWIKFYGENDKLLYHEDFADLSMSKLPAEMLGQCYPTNCQTSFASYYNTQRGTSFSFAQLDSIYQKSCGKALDVCGPITTQGYRDSLEHLVDSFYVNAKPGRVGHQLSTQEAEHFTQLSQIVHDGIIYFPDTVRQRAGEWYNNYQLNFNRFCSQNGYTIEARFKFLQNPLAGDVFYLGFRSVQATFFRNLVTTIPGFPPGLYYHTVTLYQYDNGVPESFFGYVLVDPNPDVILDWMVFKEVVKPDKVQLYYNGNVIWEHDRDPSIAIGQHANIGIGLRGRQGAIDWIRVGDVNDNTKYFEDFTDIVRPATVDPSFICAGATDCQLAFKNYYNLKRSTSYTYAQIDSIYRRAGVTLDACNEMQTSGPSSLLLCGRNEPTTESLRLQDVYDPPCSDSSILAYNSGTEIYNAYKDSLDQSFNQKYAAKCLKAASIESFKVQRPVSEYHYTLYYYDQAGNLIKTVPPAGVTPNRDSLWLDSVAQRRITGVKKVPAHSMPTVYRYNSLNQVVSQKTPDAGKSTNWYDRLGRMAVSQNAQQLIDGKYSYTVYDSLGRIEEVGQKPQITAMTNTISRNPTSLFDWIYFNNGSNTYGAEMVTRTVYDIASVDGTPCVEALQFVQKAHTLRNRVSYTRYFEKPSYAYNSTFAKYFITGLSYTSGIDYSYDIHGNVDTMRNLYGSNTYSPMTYHGTNACKTIAYTYDLISGKVNEVHYNPGQNDEFYHRYEYDPENRLTDVYTTDNKIFLYQQELEEREAKYQYYKHGPLARTIIGQQQVQGIDYIYTLQGWLKGINSNSVLPAYDPAEDAKIGGQNQYVAADLYGITLRYFTNDYKAINSAAPNPFPAYTHKLTAGTYKPLYNGNISAMTHSIPTQFFTFLYNYRYDQLNRLTAMDTYRGFNSVDNHWNSMVATHHHKERYIYDPNGNIQKAFRNSNLTTNPAMDSLSYYYTGGTNRLDHIRDSVPDASYGASTDIKNQSPGNYQYDAIGNLKSSGFRSLNEIKWNVYGKITEITKASGYLANSRFIKYNYDPSGNRIGQAHRFGAGSGTYDYTWQVRDAQGNVMAVYQVKGAANASAGTLKLTEHYIYGSNRLGMINRDINADLPKHTVENPTNLGDAYLINFTRGNKLFELTNHLGNVLATVSDVKFPVAQPGSPSVVGSYTGELVSAIDYSPFGMQLPGRIYNNQYARYRYGFNGKEMDNEVLGPTNEYDYGMRVYDPRVGRFLSVDPLTTEYPMLTPYQFASNTPIQSIDLDGLEEHHYTLNNDKNGIPQLSYSKTVTEKSLLFWSYRPSEKFIVNYKGESFEFSPAGYSSSPLNDWTANSYENLTAWLEGGYEQKQFGQVFYSTQARAILDAGTYAESSFENIAVGKTWAKANSNAAKANPSSAPNQQAASANGQNQQAVKSYTQTWVEEGKVSPALVARYNKLNAVDRSGKPFTVAGKEVVGQVNSEVNGGVMKCVDCGVVTPPAQQSKRGVVPNPNEANVDHVERKRDNGSGTPINGDIRCRNCNVVIKN